MYSYGGGFKMFEYNRFDKDIQNNQQKHCRIYSLLIAILVLLVAAGFLIYDISYANASDITVFRGDGKAVVDASGNETVIKRPTKRAFHAGAGREQRSQNRGAQIVSGGGDTLWIINNGRIRACNTVGTGYTGGSQRIKCTK